jgi:hypothetical protein
MDADGNVDGSTAVPFLFAAAEDLSAIPDASVDVVMTRSVLMSMIPCSILMGAISYTGSNRQAFRNPLLVAGRA